MWRRASQLLAGLIAVPLALGLLAFAGCPHRSAEDSETSGAGDAEPITLAIPLQPSSALALIAQEEGYFAEEGVAVRIKHPSIGAQAVQSMLMGEADAATAGDAPIAIRYFRRRDLRIFATIDSSSNDLRIVARRDRGVRGPGDLRGKRIGTQKGSSPHFFLHSYLAKQGIPESEVTLVFMRAEDLPQALASGEVDAFSMREPFVSRARELVGSKIVLFEAPGLYERTENAVCIEALVRRRPKAVMGIIEAFRRAQQLAEKDPERAIQIVAKQINISPVEMQRLWPSHDFRVRLDQSILATLEDVAQWAVQTGQADAGHRPNYLGIIYFDGLAEVDPAAITVIR